MRWPSSSPTALRFVEDAFNADTDHQTAFSNLTSATMAQFSRSLKAMGGRLCLHGEAAAGLCTPYGVNH